MINKNRRFTIEHNHCNCHPETCCCDPYKVVEITTNKTIATFYSKQKAQQLINLLHGEN